MSEPTPETAAAKDHYLIAQITVSEYMNAETGLLSFATEATEDVPLSSLLGMLRMAEHVLIDAESDHSNDDDEDDRD